MSNQEKCTQKFSSRWNSRLTWESISTRSLPVNENWRNFIKYFNNPSPNRWINKNWSCKNLRQLTRLRCKNQLMRHATRICLKYRTKKINSTKLPNKWWIQMSYTPMTSISVLISVSTKDAKNKALWQCQSSATLKTKWSQSQVNSLVRVSRRRCRKFFLAPMLRLFLIKIQALLTIRIEGHLRWQCRRQKLWIW